MHRRGLNGTRSFGAGHRQEPFPPMYGYGRACLATHADHRKGRTCRSKGDNPNPTSSKAIGPRDPADVPHRASRGGAVPILTTAHGATRRSGADALSRCPHASRGPRRLWSRWPPRATRASVSWHASASRHSSAVRACLGPNRARAETHTHAHIYRCLFAIAATLTDSATHSLQQRVLHFAKN